MKKRGSHSAVWSGRLAYGACSHAISRITFRRVLLAGLDDVVHFDKEFTRYEQAGDGTVTAYSGSQP